LRASRWKQWDGKSTAIYKFEKIKRAKRAALAANPDAEINNLLELLPMLGC